MADPLLVLVRVLASPAGEALVDVDDRAPLVELVRAEMAKAPAGDARPAIDPSACPLCDRPGCAHWNAPDPEDDDDLFSAERAKAEADCLRNKVTLEEWRARATGRIVAWDVIRDGGGKIARVGTARLAADFLRAEPEASHAEPVFAVDTALLTVGAAPAPPPFPIRIPVWCRPGAGGGR